MEINRDMSRENSSDCSVCWENARDLAVKTYRLVSNGSLSGLNSDQELKQALIKTTVFLMSYLSMAKDPDVQSQEQWAGHLENALECVGVFRAYLIIIRELGYIGEGQFLDFEDQSVQISALIQGIQGSIKEKGKGKKKSRKKRRKKFA